jgi:hypothetical protein
MPPDLCFNFVFSPIHPPNKDEIMPSSKQSSFSSQEFSPLQDFIRFSNVTALFSIDPPSPPSKSSDPCCSPHPSAHPPGRHHLPGTYSPSATVFELYVAAVPSADRYTNIVNYAPSCNISPISKCGLPSIRQQNHPVHFHRSRCQGPFLCHMRTKTQ